MRVRVLVDDLVPKGVRPVHGFSALLETEEVRLLFDTGPDGDVLVEALDRVNVAPADLDMVVVSHAHRDHSGGLARVLYDRPRLPVSVPQGAASDLARMVRRDSTLLGEAGPRDLAPWVRTTGDLGGGIPEQALLLGTDEGTCLLVGCGHPGIRALLGAVGGELALVVGGLHDLRPEDLELRGLGRVVACHCTPRKRMLAHHFDQVTLGRVGTELVLNRPGPPVPVPQDGWPDGTPFPRPGP